VRWFFLLLLFASILQLDIIILENFLNYLKMKTKLLSLKALKTLGVVNASAIAIDLNIDNAFVTNILATVVSAIVTIYMNKKNEK